MNSTCQQLYFQITIKLSKFHYQQKINLMIQMISFLQFYNLNPSINNKKQSGQLNSHTKKHMYHLSQIETQPLSPYSMQYFQQLNDQVSQINFQIKHIDHFQQQRQKKFTKSMHQYKKYLEKQRKGLQRNSQHCKLRNQWYQDEIKKSWQISISNRPLVLRSLARTNILKRQADQWLSSIDDDVLAGQINNSYPGQSSDQLEQRDQNQSIVQQNQLKGSKLINKYNQILSEYYHKI